MLETLRTVEALTSTEPIMAWRTWTLSGRRDGTGVRLRPIAGSARAWPPLQPARAACTRPRLHRAPELGCACGIYGTRTTDLLRRTKDPAVIGRVALWGRVIQHELGYRAELAYPQRLRLVCYLCFWQWGTTGSKTEVVARLSRGRLVPLCEAHVETSRRYGFPTRHLSPADEIEGALLGTYRVDPLPA